MHLTAFIFFFIFILSLFSCRKKESLIEDKANILVSYNGNNLLEDDVIMKIPLGITEQDSAILFKEIVNNWIKEQVLTDLAEEKLPNLNLIESKVQQYRNQLIISEYLKRVKLKNEPEIEDDLVKKIYEGNKNLLVVEEPLIKGFLIKINKSVPDVEKLRDIIFSQKEIDIDLIENEWIEKAEQYKFFGEAWVSLSDLIGNSELKREWNYSDLRANENIEIEDDGSLIYLHLYDFLDVGEFEPYEFAYGKIKEALIMEEIASYEEKLISDLIDKAKREHKLITVNYDPL